MWTEEAKNERRESGRETLIPIYSTVYMRSADVLYGFSEYFWFFDIRAEEVNCKRLLVISCTYLSACTFHQKITLEGTGSGHTAVFRFAFHTLARLQAASRGAASSLKPALLPLVGLLKELHEERERLLQVLRWHLEADAAHLCMCMYVRSM